MKFTTHNDHPINTDLCSKRSTIQATTQQLVKAFGQPVATTGANPIMRWSIQFENGNVASIYLWNWYLLPKQGDVVTWNVGAMQASDSWEVHQAFREAHGLLAARRTA